MNKTVAALLFHGARLGQKVSVAAAQSAPPSRVKRVGKKSGCTPCDAKKEAVRLMNRSGVMPHLKTW